MRNIFICFILTFTLAAADYTEDWNGLLKSYTEYGKKQEIETVLVNYEGIKGDGRWYNLIEELKELNPDSLRGEEAKAFWINVYNIGAVKMIIDNHPLKSIKDAGSIIKPVWNRDIIQVGDQVYSLGFIEHDILRKTGDSLIHYAIVCASLSCPDLRREAYTAEGLQEQMTRQRITFLANMDKGMRAENDTYYISKLYKWYEKDFGDPYTYLKIPEDRKIKYLDYNWSLNTSN